MVETDQFAEFNDRDLYSEVLVGNGQAADELARRHYARLLNWFRRVTRDDHEARDRVQEVFMRFFEKKPPLRGQATPGALLNGFAKKIIWEWIRGQSRKPGEIDGTPSGEPSQDNLNEWERYALEALSEDLSKPCSGPPKTSMAFPLAFFRRRKWHSRTDFGALAVQVDSPPDSLMWQVGRPFSISEVYGRYLWLRWWSEKSKGSPD